MRRRKGREGRNEVKTGEVALQFRPSIITFWLKEDLTMKKIFCVVMLVAVVNLLGTVVAWSDSKSKSNPPVITASYATEKGYYGSIWKIYIEAKDPDGDMSRIAVEVDQLGYGHYPTDWVMIKAPYRKEFKGFLQWNTFSSKTGYLREWTHITVKITVLDKAGNESNVVVFPFEFVSGAHKETKLPSPFDGEKLPRIGYIHIDLIDLTQMGADARWDN